MDVRVNATYPDHPKTLRLARLAGPTAPWHFVRLWIWAASNRQDGNLAEMSDPEIEQAAGWSGKRGRLAKALVDVGYLEGPGAARLIHDWAEHQPYVSHAPDRVARAKRAADARWRAKNDATRNAPSNAGSNADGNAPTPTPTPEEKGESESGVLLEPGTDPGPASPSQRPQDQTGPDSDRKETGKKPEPEDDRMLRQVLENSRQQHGLGRPRSGFVKLRSDPS